MNQATSLLKSLTPLGRCVALVGCWGYVVGSLAGWTELLIVGLACLVLMVVALIWVARPVRLSVDRSLTPSRITVGGWSVGTIRVRNRTKWVARAQTAEDIVGGRPVRIDLPTLAPGDQVEEPYDIHGAVRGLVQVGPVTLVRSDPLRLCRVVQGQGSTVHLWVQPHIEALPPAMTGRSKERDGRTTETSPRGSAAFHALREYQRGDDLRHVHWRTTARTNQLMVRHYVDTDRSDELLVLDSRIDSYPDGRFEEAVSVAASLSAAMSRTGVEPRVAVSSQPDSPFLNANSTAMDRLTLATLTSSAPVQSVFAQLRDHRDWTGLIAVTGDVDAQAFAFSARVAAPHRSVIVIRCRDVPRASLSTVGGVTVIDTPTAAALAGVWGRAVKAA
jgi:uncharacterized protein (DUF58 family)